MKPRVKRERMSWEMIWMRASCHGYLTSFRKRLSSGRWFNRQPAHEIISPLKTDTAINLTRRRADNRNICKPLLTIHDMLTSSPYPNWLNGHVRPVQKGEVLRVSSQSAAQATIQKLSSRVEQRLYSVLRSISRWTLSWFIKRFIEREQ